MYKITPHVRQKGFTIALKTRKIHTMTDTQQKQYCSKATGWCFAQDIVTLNGVFIRPEAFIQHNNIIGWCYATHIFRLNDVHKTCSSDLA